MSSLREHVVLTLLILGTAQIPPEFANKTTLYHLNPASAGALPVNMDTGDALGDLYFYLGQFLLPIECANASSQGRAHFDCDNPERVDPNLVVTKVDLQIDQRFTNYSACNLCNGTDPFTRKPCDVGTYVCDCFSQGQGACDPTKVGWENITEHFAPRTPTSECTNAFQSTCGAFQKNKHACEFCVKTHKSQLEAATCQDRDLYSFCPSSWGGCNATSPEWACWEENIPRKTGGFWYSTLKEGQCAPTSTPGSCGWKVDAMKTVKETCLKSVLMSTVEAHDASGCFQGCGPRNQTSPCWIECFFDTLLGVDARHSSSKPLGGMTAAEIEKGWTNAFSPKEEGGCEEVSMSPLVEVIV